MEVVLKVEACKWLVEEWGIIGLLNIFGFCLAKKLGESSEC